MDWMRLAKRLLFPPVWLIVVLTIASAVLLMMVFSRGWEHRIVGYGVYVLAFYTLSTAVLFCAVVLPKRYGLIRQKIYDNPFVGRYLTDRAFRTGISLHASLGISVLYVLLNLWSWRLNRSWWFVVLAVYYLIMAVMRFLLVGYVRKNRIGGSVLKEWRRSRVCALILLLVNLSLSAAVLMILYQSKGYHYPGIMIYVMALYSFYSAIHAAVDIVRYRRLGSPILSTAKIVSLSAALVSMLNLETAMFAQFGGDMDPGHQRIFIILTGAGVSAAVVTLSVILIVNATKAIGREKHGE